MQKRRYRTISQPTRPIFKTGPIINYRWVFTTKYSPHGTMNRYKARIVARGITQTYAVDYRLSCGLSQLHPRLVFSGC